MNRVKSDHITALVFAVAILAVGCLINLPFHYVQHGGRWVKSPQDQEAQMLTADTREKTYAGWPFRYRAAHQVDGQATVRFHSWPKAIGNALIILVAACLVYFATCYRRRSIRQAENPGHLHRRFDLITAGLFLALPAAVILHSWFEKTAHQRLATGACTQRGGNCYLASSLPDFCANRIPQPLADCFLRVRAVYVRTPTENEERNADLKSLFQLGTLISCKISGDGYDQTMLRELAGDTELVDIAIRRSDLDVETMTWLGQVPHLINLNLNNTNVTGEHLEQIRHLKEVQSLSLVGAPIRLEEIPSDAAWCPQIRTFSVSRPSVGKSDRLRIDGWEKLESLQVIRESFQDNPAICELWISNCPRLGYAMLDRLQKFSIRFENLPRLVEFGQDMSTELIYTPREKHIPGSLWCSTIDLDGMPNLERLHCLTTDLQSLRIRNSENLKVLSLASFRQHGGGYCREIPTDPTRCQKLLDDMGKIDGVESLYLEMLPLETSDLSGLAQNRTLKKIYFAATGVSMDQIKAMAPMDQIEELHLGECDVASQNLDWLLETFPRLRIAGINVFGASVVSIDGNEKLENLSLTAVQSPQSVQIRDAPRLQSTLYLLAAPQQLAITGSPSIQGLVVDGLWPSNAEIQDLRMLRCFASGGPELTDNIVDQLRFCDDLDELTLAYSNLSPAGARKIGQFKKLSTLQLPGAPISDDVAREWTAIKRIQHINLDDTEIDSETIRWAVRLPNLQSFSINRVPLSDEARSEVTQLGQLTVLGLAHTNCTESDLVQVLQPGQVERLEIGGVEVGDALVRAIIECQRLQSLSLDQCAITTEQLQTILTERTELTLDYTHTDDSLDQRIADNLEQRRLEQESQNQRELQRIPLKYSIHATSHHVAERHRPAIERTILTESRHGKVDLTRLRQQSGWKRYPRTNITQNGASSSSTASDNAAFASSTAAPVTPPYPE